MTRHDQPAASDSPSEIGTPLLLTLALLTGTAPFAIDMYLPAFPQMVGELATTTAGIQLTLTTFLIGAGLGQLVFGPLSDRLGRRGPLLAGLALYLMASIATALAPTIEALVAARLVQGLAGAAGMVISRAIVADRAHGAEAARALSIMMLVGGIAPVVAPLVGSVLAEPLGWRGLLWAVAGIVGAGLVATLLLVRESRPHAGHAPERRAGAASPMRALASRAYLGNTLAFVFAFTALMAYIAASPFFYQSMIGLDAVGYGLAFGLNALALMVVGAVSARRVRTAGAAALARTGLRLNLAAVAVLAALAVAGVPQVWLAVPVLVAVASFGLIFGNTAALALGAVPAAAGLGSAVLGMLQHVLAGAVAPLVGVGGELTALPLALTMLAASAAASIAFAAARSPAHPHTPPDIPHAPPGERMTIASPTGPSAPFELQQSRAVRLFFRATALIEAFTWAGLLSGMFIKYALHGTPMVVTVFGWFHGAAWIAFLAASVIAAIRFRWPVWALPLGLVMSLLPFLTVPFDVWMERTGRLRH